MTNYIATFFYIVIIQRELPQVYVHINLFIYFPIIDVVTIKTIRKPYFYVNSDH